MLSLVIPQGPRVGSSFLLSKAHEAGLPVISHDLEIPLPIEGQPRTQGRYFECDPAQVPDVKEGVLKAWPLALHRLSVKPAGVIILSRHDTEAQKRSFQLQQARELEAFGHIPELADTIRELKFEDHLQRSQDVTQRYLTELRRVPIMWAQTENLSRDSRGLVEFLRAPL